MIAFYSHTKGPYRIFSQFYPARFTVDNITFNCAEQFMMYKKAEVFGDTETAAMILAERNPVQIKSLGRGIKKFDDKKWNAVKFDIVVAGNTAKFTQNPSLASVLSGTGTQILVEASPTDCIWGVGLAYDDPRLGDPSKWRGKNLLGEALMKVRQKFCRVV